MALFDRRLLAYFDDGGLRGSRPLRDRIADYQRDLVEIERELCNYQHVFGEKAVRVKVRDRKAWLEKHQSTDLVVQQRAERLLVRLQFRHTSEIAAVSLEPQQAAERHSDEGRDVHQQHSDAGRLAPHVRASGKDIEVLSVTLEHGQHQQQDRGQEKRHSKRRSSVNKEQVDSARQEPEQPPVASISTERRKSRASVEMAASKASHKLSTPDIQAAAQPEKTSQEERVVAPVAAPAKPSPSPAQATSAPGRSNVWIQVDALYLAQSAAQPPLTSYTVRAQWQGDTVGPETAPKPSAVCDKGGYAEICKVREQIKLEGNDNKRIVMVSVRRSGKEQGGTLGTCMLDIHNEANIKLQAHELYDGSSNKVGVVLRFQIVVVKDIGTPAPATATAAAAATEKLAGTVAQRRASRIGGPMGKVHRSRPSVKAQALPPFARRATGHGGIFRIRGGGRRGGGRVRRRHGSRRRVILNSGSKIVSGAWPWTRETKRVLTSMFDAMFTSGLTTTSLWIVCFPM